MKPESDKQRDETKPVEIKFRELKLLDDGYGYQKQGQGWNNAPVEICTENSVVPKNQEKSPSPGGGSNAPAEIYTANTIIPSSKQKDSSPKGGGPGASHESPKSSRIVTAVAHPLMFRWVLWELKPGNKHHWTESLQQIDSFDTVEDFWRVHKRWPSASSLSTGSDYYLFRQGIQPNWEDEMNVRGGRWQAIIPGKQYLPIEKSAANLDSIWLELKMSVIGAQYGVDNPKVCGVAAHVRRNQDKVALWVSDTWDAESRDRIGQLFKHKLDGIPLHGPHDSITCGSDSLKFSLDVHAESFQRYANFAAQFPQRPPRTHDVIIRQQSVNGSSSAYPSEVVPAVAAIRSVPPPPTPTSN